MNSTLSRFLTALLIAFVLLASACNAEGEGDCITESEGQECANPDADVPEVREAVAEDPNCPSREHVIRCSGIHLDTNKNGKLERLELQSAIDRLPWYSRGQ